MCPVCVRVPCSSFCCDASWRGSGGLSGPHSALEAFIGILICRRDTQQGVVSTRAHARVPLWLRVRVASAPNAYVRPLDVRIRTSLGRTYVPWTYVPWTCVPWAGVGARISPHLAMATLLFADLVPSRRAACLGLGRSDIGGDKGMVVGRRMREELSQRLSRKSESDSCTRDEGSKPLRVSSPPHALASSCAGG